MLAVDFFHVDCATTLKRIYAFLAKCEAADLPSVSGHLGCGGHAEGVPGTHKVSAR